MGNQADLEQALNVTRLYSGPNMLDNPQMEIKQRVPISYVPYSNGIPVDRWNYINSGVGVTDWNWSTFAAFGVAMAPNRPRPAHVAALKMTTADAALAAGDFMQMYQNIEGQDLQHLKWSTAEAQPVTISFDVYCSVTDTFVVELVNATAARQISALFTSQAATWTTIILTFPGDTGGSYIADDASAALLVSFTFAAGTTYTSGTPNRGTWGTSATANRYPGVGNVFVSTAPANQLVAVTNAKLEVGSVATKFVAKTYKDELQKCQRYFYNYAVPAGVPVAFGQCYLATNAVFTFMHPVVMRAAPTFSTPNAALWSTTNAVLGQIACTGLPQQNTTVRTAYIASTVAAGLVAGDAAGLYSNNAASEIQFTAEI